jgi:hypothetical protein
MEDRLRAILKQNIDGWSGVGLDEGPAFFYTCAQLLVYVLTMLGGCDRFKKELNYMTNPYIPRDISEIANRVLRFFANLSKRSILSDQTFDLVYSLIVANRDAVLAQKGNEALLEEAFFAGLHGDNVLLRVRA